MGHFFTPDEAGIAGATAAGTFVALLVRRPDWRAMLSWFIVGQLTSFYWAATLAMWIALGDRPVGFAIGAICILLWTAIFSLSQKLSEDPLGTIASLWRTFRGQGGSER